MTRGWPWIISFVVAGSILISGCRGEQQVVELSHPWLFAINPEGEWVPRDGLVWTNPDDPDDYSVRPAPGYAWASNPGEDLVGPEGELLPYYSRDAMAARSGAPTTSEGHIAEGGGLEQSGNIVVEWIELTDKRISRYNSRVRVTAGIRADPGSRGTITFRIRPGTGDASVFGSIPIVSDAPTQSSEISFVPIRTGTMELVASLGDVEVSSTTMYISAD